MGNSVDSIEQAVKNLLSAVGRYADDCKLESFEASIADDFERSQKVLDHSKNALRFRTEIEALYARWTQSLQSNRNNFRNSPKRRKKRNRKTIAHPGNTIESSQADPDNGQWIWSDRNAVGIEQDGMFIVRKGAIMALEPRNSLKGRDRSKFNEIIRGGLVSKTTEGWLLEKDVVFVSRAQAANVLDGYSQSANRVWLKQE
jgi:hypothetical protein